MFKRIDSLNNMMLKFGVQYSIYDFQNCYTVNELISAFLYKINEIVDDVNLCNILVNDFIKWCKDEGLINTVTVELQKMYNNGTLENLINKNLFATLDTKITNFNKELNDKIEQQKLKSQEEIKKVDYIAKNVNKKIDEVVINVKDYGAKGNANYFNKSNYKYYQDKENKILAIDDSVGIQKAIDKLIDLGGGTLYFPNGNYNVESTIYINPTNSSTPISLKGCCPIASIYYHDYENNKNTGSRIICNNNIVFSVNRDNLGNQKNGGSFAWFESFSCENIGFIGVPTSQNNTYKSSIAFYILGTRFNIKNCGAFGLDYLIFSPLKDTSKKDNYCDLCNVNNIYAKQTQKSLIRMTRCDLSTITNIYHEEPTDTFKNVLEIVGGVGVEIDTILNAMNVKTFDTNIFESCIVLVRKSKGVKVSNIFTTKNTNLTSMLIFHNCENVDVNNINENGLKKENKCVNMIIVKSCENVVLKNITSYSTRKEGHYDIKFEYGETQYKSNVILENLRFRNMEKGDNKESDRLPLIGGCQYTTTIDYRDIKKIELNQTDSKNMAIMDNRNFDLSTMFGKPIISNDKVYFNYNVNGNKNMLLHMCFDVKRKYVGDNLQHEPLIKKNTTEELSVIFINDNKIMTSLDTNVSFTLIQI